MAKLRVTIIDEVRDRRLKVDLPDDAAMEKLLPALVKKLGLPPAAYQLTHEATGRALGGDQSLASFGVGEGDALRLAAAKKKLPVWGWVAIVGVLVTVAGAFWAFQVLKPAPTPTAVVEVASPTATPVALTFTSVPPTDTPVPPTATPIPTSTPRPTATPVPPTDTPVPPTATPMPTSTPTPPPLTYDENFNDPAFDGTYNTGLWSRLEGANGSTSTVEQRDGVLVVNQTSGLWDSFAGLSTEKHSNWLLSDLGYVEARLMLDSNFDGQLATSQFIILSNDTDWWLNCQFSTCKTVSWCQSPDRPWMVCYSPDQYAPDGIGVEYNTWHTARIEVDPETVTFHFYFDGYYYDSFTPPNATTLKDDSFHVEVGLYLDSKSSATGYIDDVRIGK